MAELKILRAQRSAIRTNITKEFNKPTNSFADETTIDPVAIQTSLDKVEQLHKDAKGLSEKIVRLLPDERDMNDEISKTSDYDDLYLDKFNLLNNRLASYRQSQITNLNTSEHAFNASSASDTAACSVKLPKLEITKFDGDAAHWSEFWDSFDATIHSHPQLSPIDKFKYLKGFLSKDAFKLADGYKLTAANYDEVVACLKQRYGNPELAIFQHFEQLLAITVANNDFKSLQEVYDDCEKHIRSLEALGIGEDTFGRVFTPIILSKVPKFVRLDLHRQNGLKPWTLSSLRTLLKTEIQVREMSQHSFGSRPTEPVTKPAKFGSSAMPNRFPRQVSQGFPRLPNKVSQGTAFNLVNSGSVKRATCAFCGGAHDHDSCRKYPTAEVRRHIVKGKCFICFRDNHRGSACQTNKRCQRCGSRWHHSSLCTNENRTTPVQQSLNACAPEFVPPLTTGASHHSKPTYMQTAIAGITSSDRKSSVRARLIFDTASSRTYVTTDLCQQVGAVPVGRDIVSIAAFGAKKRYTKSYPIVNLDVQCQDGTLQRIEALVTDYICRPVAIYPIDFAKHPSLKPLTFAEVDIDKPVLGAIDVLIGGDYYYRFVTGMLTVDEDLTLISSRLGYLLAGRASTASSQGFDNSLACNLLRLTNQNLQVDRNFQLERFWNLEEVGIKEKLDTPDDEIALQKFEESVQFVDGRYHIRWPWKVEEPDLPSNFYLALGRLKSTLRRIKAEPQVFETYTENINEQEKLGIIERVPIDVADGPTHYLPHHCVVKPERATTKVRIVYDASAKANNQALSLNECLYRGPVILTDLCGLLIRFRLKPIGVIADLEKAFMQIVLQKDQRDVTRFLWLKDPAKPVMSENLTVYRFCRVLFGVIASPFILAATIVHHLKSSKADIAESLSNCLYVDNIITGGNDLNSLLTFQRQAKELFQSAAMNLREWYCNDERFMKTIPHDDRGTLVTPKVLGLRWELKEDTLSCPKFRVDPDINTKRQMLQCLAHLYDPCGFFAPIIVIGKALLQELWRGGYKWDDPLPDHLVEQWRQFSTSFVSIQDFPLPRIANLAPGTGVTYELHCFCDASARVYAAAVYLLTISGSKHRCRLLFSKCRIAPTKPMTIPKLELLAVFIGAKILDFVTREIQLPLQRRVIWSDSQCTLHWISNEQNNVRFVANRVNVIRQLTNGVNYRYVPTKDNPADLASRGCAAPALFQSTIWWNGPEWLPTSALWPVNAVPQASHPRLFSWFVALCC